MQIVINILIMIVMLGVLIALHELGHLATAKMFNVYCFEYSIGFGPKLFKVKRKKGETHVSLRVLPLGGFVSMYGESDSVPEGMEAPDPARSLEKKKVWQKAIIMLAGVTVNYILGIILIFVSVSAFKIYYTGYGQNRQLSSDISTTCIYNSASIKKTSSIYEKLNQEIIDTGSTYAPNQYFVELANSFPVSDKQYVSVIDGDVELFKNDESLGHYVCVYSPSNLIKDHALNGDILLFPAAKNEDDSPKLAPTEYNALGIKYIPNISKPYSLKGIKSEGELKFALDLTFIPMTNGNKKIINNKFEEAYSKKIDITIEVLSKNEKWKGLGLTVNPLGIRNDWKGISDDFSYYFPWANKAIAQGLVLLFTPEGIKNASGIIGMTAAVGSVVNTGGASRLFLYAGMISINLAFFNLLPFPGLDGWQLLVTIIEGISKKKIPNKVKTIVTLVGYGLLLILVVAIAIKDIIQLVV